VNIFKDFARYYDQIYQDKNYSLECDLIETIFREYGKGASHEVLDLGCGSGGHSVILARRGYHVDGLDRSEEMLSIAREKALHEGIGYNLRFHNGDIRHFTIEGLFDAAVMMFAVLGYQHENSAVLSTLKSIRRHLRPDGLLIFDIWYGPAVLAQRPAQRVKLLSESGRRVLRIASGSLDTRRHLSAVHYHILEITDDRLVAEAQEDHTMRFFFPMELEFLLDSSGFDLLRLTAFPGLEKEADETTWNALVVARAVEP
jgi:SAM-dependent methyltransferase